MFPKYPKIFFLFYLKNYILQDDREEILKVLCTKHNLNQDDFDLKLLAKMSINFTGADLNAVFIQARMNAIDNNYFEISKVSTSYNLLLVRIFSFLRLLLNPKPKKKSFRTT